MSVHDPIMAELRAIREAHAAQYDYDFDRMFAALMAEQEASGRKLFYGKPKPLRPRTVGPDEPPEDPEAR